MTKSFTRRDFLGQSSKLAVGSALLPTILTSCSNWKGANDRIVVGHIGVGDRGTNELMSYFVPLREALNIAVCDTFRDRRESAQKRISQFYKDKTILVTGGAGHPSDLHDAGGGRYPADELRRAGSGGAHSPGHRLH